MRTSPVLVVHIVSAFTGLVSGTVAMCLKKGSRRHGAAGNVFVVSMLLMGASGAELASVSHYVRHAKTEMANIFMGGFTIYLASTGWWAGRRRDGVKGPFDGSMMALGVVVATEFLTYGVMAVRSGTGAMDGMPAAGYFVFGTIAALFCMGDVRMLLGPQMVGKRRIARHLGRTGFVYLITVFSFFLGKQNDFPAAWRGLAVWYLPPLMTIGALVYWLVRVRLPRRFRRVAVAEGRELPRQAMVR